MHDQRKDHNRSSLGEEDLDRDPIRQFLNWFEDASQSGIAESNAMALATSTPDGRPSVRIVLLRGVDARGFAFYTNYESRKARELEANPQAALVFFWHELERQVRVEGRVDAFRTTSPTGTSKAGPPVPGLEPGLHPRAKSSPTVTSSRHGSVSSRRSTKMETCPVRPTGAGTGYCPSRSNSGRGASTACTTGCGIPSSHSETGSSNDWRPESRRALGRPPTGFVGYRELICEPQLTLGLSP